MFADDERPGVPDDEADEADPTKAGPGDSEGAAPPSGAEPVTDEGDVQAEAGSEDQDGGRGDSSTS